MNRDDIVNMVTLGVEIPDTWLLLNEKLPFRVNEARRWHYHKLAKNVKEWREDYFLLSKEAKVPKLGSADIHCMTFLKRMGRDTAAEVLALKGAVDGAITDAGVLPDDKPPFINSITFHAPYKWNTNALALVIVKTS